MSSLLGIGVSGLRAQQAALNVVGQNITNASTPGYTRQRADIVTQIGGANVGLGAGAGVQIQGVSRIHDAFVDQQIRTDTSAFTQLEAYTEQVQALESTLFDGQYGIDAALRGFFDAVQNASNEPADLAQREFVISSAEALVTRFKGVTDRS